MAWTPTEDALLLEAYERGESHREIAVRLYRSRQAIGYRLNCLGLHRRPSRRGGDAERFDRMVERRGEDDCWPWRGPVFSDGYGMFSLWPRVVRASRYAWERANGRDLRDGEVVRHSCDRPLCMNPAHLLVGSHLDNERDKVARGRQARGERHGMARYSADQIERVKALLAARVSRRAIAAETGVKLATIQTVATGRQWREVVRRCPTGSSSAAS